MNTVNSISSADCTGCGACANICPKSCISMKENNIGFLEPIIDSEKCVGCGKCYLVCKEKRDRCKLEKAFAFKSYNNNMLLNCSSGGAYGEICKVINSMHTNVAFYGAAFDSRFTVNQQYVETLDEIKVFFGSKYVQSRMNHTYQTIEKQLSENKYVFFSGTPCQVDGVKRYLSIRKIKDDKLFTVDIMCHGVPSEKVWKDYLAYTEKKYKSKILNYSFRAKELGWKHYPIKITFANRCVNNKYEDRTYINLFRSHLIFRESCYKCKFATKERTGDITIADFWGVEQCIPGIDTSEGVSLVLPNTIKGNDIVNRMNEAGLLLQTDYLTAVKLQNNLNQPCECPDNIEKFWEYYLDNGYIKSAKKYSNTNVVGYMKLWVKTHFNL